MMCYNNAVKRTLLQCMLPILYTSFRWILLDSKCSIVSFCLYTMDKTYNFYVKSLVFSGNCFVSISACGFFETLKWMHKNFMRHLCEIKRLKQLHVQEKLMMIGILRWLYRRQYCHIFFFPLQIPHALKSLNEYYSFGEVFRFFFIFKKKCTFQKSCAF